MATSHWNIKTPDTDAVDRITTEFGLTRPVAMALVNSGVEPEDVKSFLDPRLQDLRDPYELPGLREAAERLWKAVHAGERILVHGDYDTDGITSTVLLAWVLREHGALVDSYLPNRFDDGYGFTEESVVRAVADGQTLMVTVDCGITGNEAATAARKLGVDVIITDHHQPGDEIPDALVVANPKLHPHMTELQVLAGVGVSFKLCHAFVKYGREHELCGEEFQLRDGLDLVALGTVADIVPVVGENRILVRHGMKVLSEQRRPGIRALCDKVGLSDRLKPEDIAFRLAPRLNAAGRLGDAVDALRLLEAQSIVDAYQLADNLDGYNKKRQQHEEKAFKSAAAQIEELGLSSRCALVVKGKNWHRGVIGIVASRLTQAFHRPAIVLSIDDNGEIHGSGRSVHGVDLVKALDSCREHLTRYGGHPMASGLALHEPNLPAFEDAFEAAVKVMLGARTTFGPTVDIEGVCRVRELDEQFFRELDMLQPFGHRNTPPVFLFENVYCARVAPAGRNHARGVLTDGSGGQMPFIAFGRTPRDLPPQPWSLAATPSINTFRGESNPQLQIQDVRSAECPPDTAAE